MMTSGQEPSTLHSLSPEADEKASLRTIVEPLASLSSGFIELIGVAERPVLLPIFLWNAIRDVLSGLENNSGLVGQVRALSSYLMPTKRTKICCNIGKTNLPSRELEKVYRNFSTLAV